MDPHVSSLLAKAIWSAAIVLGLAAIAERVGTRIAGIVAGTPMSAVLIYLFVGLDMGSDYVVASVPHGVAAFSATLAFVLAYHRASLWFGPHGVLGTSAVALAAFFAVALPLARIPFGITGATALTAGSVGLAIWLFRHIEFRNVEKPVRYTFRLIAMRAGMASLLIVGAIAVAEALGPRWTGIMAGFPSILLPTLVIIHASYGRAHAHAVMRNFPIGMVSVVLFVLSTSVTFPHLGVYGGTAASMAVSLTYLAAIMALGLSRPAGAAAPVRCR